jgi:flagellar biosynthesis/type III secretory pathway protein FliH
MAAHYNRSGNSSVLFEEDFDLPQRAPAPPPPPEPEVIEPVFSAAELAAARTEAWREADQHARAELADVGAAATAKALEAIAAQLSKTAGDARAIAEETAEALAHLLLAGFAAAFPALCRRHGPAEVQAVLRTLLPALESEPKVTIRVEPAALAAVRQELDQLDPDLVARMQIVPAEGLRPGDVRVAWQAGQATRDTARLWQDIEAVLAPTGLLPPEAPIPAETERTTTRVLETTDGN